MQTKPSHSSQLVQCLHIDKRYENGCVLFEDATLLIQRGEIAFLIGPGGAGKTAFFRCLLGFEALTRGYICVDGHEIQSMDRRKLSFIRSRMGMVFQEDKLVEHWSVFENVAMPLEAQGKSRLFIQRRAPQVLQFAGLSGKKHALCDQLSRGERRRAAIARAIAGDPLLLLADEPLGNLDEQSSQDVVALIGDIHLRGITIIVATSNPVLPASFPGSRAIVIEQGKFQDRTLDPESADFVTSAVSKARHDW